MTIKNKNPVQTRFDFWDVAVVDKNNYNIKTLSNKQLITKKHEHK